MRALTWSALLVAVVGSFGMALATTSTGCGGTDTATGDGGNGEGGNGEGGSAVDAGPACVQVGTACGSSAECCSANCDATSKTCAAAIGSCKAPGTQCQTGNECCTYSCNGGTCSQTKCINDNAACNTDAECCGGKCAAAGDGGSKTCVPLNPSCKTSGNTCAGNSECCSSFCNNGVCNGSPSFCTQNGDTCANDTDCCGGLCTKATGATLGTCGLAAASGTPGCSPAGQVCTGATTGGDGGVICGGDCCSRSCRPYAATGITICEPPSGCHPTGEICLNDSDCCGVNGSPGSTKAGSGKSTNVTCSKAPGATIGRCDNGQACSPAGAICRLATNSCNATDECCAGTVQTHPLNCKQDDLGIPRCTAATDLNCANGAPPPGTACASSADCCNAYPCVPNPSGAGFVCGSTACVPTSGACTTTADCCSGEPCNVPTGSTKGTCGAPSGGGGTPDGGVVTSPDSGTTGGGGTGCGQYGQVCTAGSCCAPLQCNTTTNRCSYTVN